MVSGSMRSPFWVRRQPLKSPHQTRLGSSAAANGAVWGSTRRRLRARDDQPFATQQFAHCAGRWPTPLRLLARQHHLQLPRSPPHVLLPQFHDLLLRLRRHLVGMRMRRTTSLRQPRPALALVAVHRVVSRLPRDALPGTQFRHGPVLRQPLLHKHPSLIHYSAHFPRHAPL